MINNLTILCSQSKGLFPADYDAEDLSTGSQVEFALDPNHTHFILVDDGTQLQLRTEIGFRTEFESYLSGKQTGVTSEQCEYVTYACHVAVVPGHGTIQIRLVHQIL